MGSQRDDDNVTPHQQRTEHKLAPVIQRPPPKVVGKKKFSRLLTPYDYFLLAQNLPANALSWSDYEKSERKATEDLSHQLIFSSQRDGTSWQVFVNKIVGQGATIVVFKAKDGSLFGGYADEAWQQTTDWTGVPDNFLFRLRLGPNGNNAMGVWEGHKGVNNHFQYLCWGKKSLPNGLGMGGQFDYAGLWLNSDFLNGHTRGGPLCTTYMSPSLASNDKFQLDEAEVWLVRPLPKEDEETKGSALDRTEDMEFLEMAGKKLYSKDLGKPENVANKEEEEEEE
ncbi:TLD-domain-containing protein [Phycomyces nitens]|nr:TLD-domain-containing protein [Phycomyces nitens]